MIVLQDYLLMDMNRSLRRVLQKLFLRNQNFSCILNDKLGMNRSPQPYGYISISIDLDTLVLLLFSLWIYSERSYP